MTDIFPLLKCNIKDFRKPCDNGGLNNGWNLIMENITCGDGNHEWYIEFITSGEATSDKFNISQVITITTSDIFHYQIPAVV